MQIGRIVLMTVELLIVTALVFATRCANYEDVFVSGNVYFTDADCYARMTRVRLCAAHPGLVLRHHDFENFPNGTSPHTTAPFDYSILGLSILLKPFVAQSIDVAGAFISPLLAVIGGWFLWWWSRRMRFRYRWILLILYGTSPILIHATELGRPDHQSLVLLLILIAACSEWTLQSRPNERQRIAGWAMLNGAAWSLAIWVSAYEPLILLIIFLLIGLFHRQTLMAKERRAGWIVFGVVIALALLVERRIPSLFAFRTEEFFRNWSRTIGELIPVLPLNSIWFRWAGYLIIVSPILIWLGFLKKRPLPIFVIGLLLATFCLTIWQARWAYFFIAIFAIAMPVLFETIQSRAAVWIALALSLWPILRDWDERLWPNESVLAARLEHRVESEQLREIALTIRSPEIHPFLAPWWLSPEIAYWSDQPGVAGSSHESLDGIVDSARFFLTANGAQAREILTNRKVDWVVSYDSDRLATNSAEILGIPIPIAPFCHLIDRTPSQVPAYLVLAAQTPSAKLFRVVNSR